MTASAREELRSVIVVHPGVQHSRELARALDRNGMLAKLVTSHDGASTWLSRVIRRPASESGLDPGNVCAMPYFDVLFRLARPLLPAPLAYRASLVALDLFDRQAARRVLRERPRVVTAFEGCAWHVFEAARAVGAVRVLDAPSLHHAAQPAEGTPYGLRELVDKGKDAELALADHVVVLSTVARDTFVRAGVAPSRISVIPPGLWRNAGAPQAAEKQGPVKFLFVGNVKHAKGVDLLLRAFRPLAQDATLTLAGAIIEPALLEGVGPPVRILGRLGRAALEQEYARSDVLVLPSRADGFGMVVIEAMAAGMPAIVSTATGAVDLVAPGRNGWVFESGDAGQLAAAMRDAVSDRVRLALMSSHARQDASHLTWERYSDAIAALYRALLDGAGTRQAGRV